MWSRICEAEPDAFCWEVFHALESELAVTGDGGKLDEAKTGLKKEGKAGKGGRGSATKVDVLPQDQKVLWDTLRELFEFEVEWVAQSIEGGEFNDSSIFQGPVFTFVVRGFSSLEATLDHYFSPKIIEDGSGVRVRTTRRFRRLPHVLQWYLKRGDYDCCTGLCGLTDTYLGFPRQIDMSKYCEGSGVYNLYGVMVESDEHYWSYIRPEMEGDQGQWYRFDDRESSTCAMSNATAIDASFGGEEWLCVNYLYGPSAVLTRPKESRACLLVYLKESAMDVLLREPRLPKISREYQSTGLQRDGPTRAVEAEAAAAAAQALIEEVEAQAMKEEKKRKQKQKKKQKEKERRSQARSEELCDAPGDERKSDGKVSPAEGLSEDDLQLPVASKSQHEVLAAALGKQRSTGGVGPRESSADSAASKGFEENHRSRVRKRSKGGAKAENKTRVEEACSPAQSTSDLCAQTPSRRTGDISRDKWGESHKRCVDDSSPKQPAQGVAQAAAGGGSGTPAGQINSNAGNRTSTTSKASLTTLALEPRPNGTPAPVAAVERQEASPSKFQQAKGATSAANCQEVRDMLEVTVKDRAVGQLSPSGSAPASVGSHGISSRPSPSCSSRTPASCGYDEAANNNGVRVFPEQLVTQDVVGALGEYAQFVCKICNLVVRSPLVLPCAHMFCSSCFNQWVQQKRPNVMCPTCEQAVVRQEVVHFEGRSSTPGGGALALLHRLYAGMKVRCIYHPELLCSKPLTGEAEAARKLGFSCTWRGAMHDYAGHLGHCKVHASVSASTCAGASSSAGLAAGRASASTPFKSQAPLAVAALPSVAPTTPTLRSRAEQSWTHITGAFQALAPWHSQEAGALCVQQGATLWVTSTDESGEWAYARVLQPRAPVSSQSVSTEAPPPAWVPRAVLQRAIYPAYSVFDAQGQAQGLSLCVGDFVHVYHREASGWTYGARLERRPQKAAVAEGLQEQHHRPEEVGWFPEACITEPLPVA
mmetsp:Transcript_79043/g.183377  ORF Transcript_79043/g.183377 Transcript_79043/m.183377 type:complete len:988 (+) Transcript_79043:131-3094(+)